MEIIDNRAIKLRVRKPDRITEVIPKSKVLSEDDGVYEVLVHWGLEEMQVLKNLGIKNVPSPILGRYNWPGMYKPFEHQLQTAAFLTMHRRAYCLNEMGCVDSETEYLSPTGWVKISEYAGGEVAQYHPDSRAIEFVAPIEYVKKPCTQMIRFKTSRGVDQLLSPEHRVLLYNQDGTHKVVSAISVQRSWIFGSLGKAFIWNGTEMVDFLDYENSSVYFCDSTDGFKYCFSVPSTFLLFRRNGCVFASGNTGKSCSALWAADYLMSKGLVRRVLVVCPLSIMDSAWRADAFKSVMHRTVDIAHGARDKRKKIIASDTEIIIINYDGIEIVAEDIARSGFDLIIIDEYNHYKNAQSKRWKVMNTLIKNDTWLWGMTGSPASQSPLDAYGLAKLMNPSSVPKFYGAFRDSIMTKITQFKYIPKLGAEDMVHKLLQPAIRYTKEDCLDLPEMLYTTREVPLTPQQNKYYKQLKEQMLIEAAGEEVTAVNAAVNLSKLMQIAVGSIYTNNKEVLEFDASNRLNALEEIIDESSHKVLVFANFRHGIEMIQRHLAQQGYSVDVIHGGVPVGVRTDVFNRFQTTNEPRVLVIQPQSAAHGVTLTAANTIVWFGPVTSYETYVQANARVHRAGQKNSCMVVHLTGSPVEDKLYRALEQKERMQDSIMSLYEEEIRGGK